MISGPSLPTLVGERLTLRPYGAGFSESELALLYAWARDDDLLALCGGARIDLDYPRFREVFLEQCLRQDPEREQIFGIVNPAGRLVGRIGLFGLSRASGSHGAELGIVIGDRDSWGQGYGREAAGILADYAFGRLGLRQVTLYTFPANRRARQAFAAAGFSEIRKLRRFNLELGTHDEVEMQIRPADRLRLAPIFDQGHVETPPPFTELGQDSGSTPPSADAG